MTWFSIYHRMRICGLKEQKQIKTTKKNKREKHPFIHSYNEGFKKKLSQVENDEIFIYENSNELLCFKKHHISYCGNNDIIIIIIIIVIDHKWLIRSSMDKKNDPKTMKI